MTDWRELPAGRELDRVVAEWLGHEVINYPRDVVGLDEDEAEPMYVFGPYEPDKMWPLKPIPRYSADVSAALALLPDRYWSITNDNYSYTIVIIDESSQHPKEDGLAEAVTRAWLAYMEAQADD